LDRLAQPCLDKVVKRCRGGLAVVEFAEQTCEQPPTIADVADKPGRRLHVQPGSNRAAEVDRVGWSQLHPVGVGQFRTGIDPGAATGGQDHSHVFQTDLVGLGDAGEGGEDGFAGAGLGLIQTVDQQPHPTRPDDAGPDDGVLRCSAR